MQLYREYRPDFSVICVSVYSQPRGGFFVIEKFATLKGLSSEILGGSNVISFDRSRFKDVLLGLFLKFYSAAILYFSQIPLAEYNTKKVAFFGFFGFL